MTDVPFAAVSGDASARPIQALLTRTRFRAKAATFEIAKLQFDRPGGGSKKIGGPRSRRAPRFCEQRVVFAMGTSKTF